jgi:sarcosine oxidase delta subunit
MFMSQLENEQFKKIDWDCPHCGNSFLEKRIGISFHSFFPPYVFCKTGCARYFTIDKRDVTLEVISLEKTGFTK